MPIDRFPDPRKAGAEGIVAIGGDLHPDSLIEAYRQGIFPWPHEGYPLLWFSPDPRAILKFDELHVSQSLSRARRRMLGSGWTVTVDRAFIKVIDLCSRVPRPGQSGTWITPEMKEAYVRLHRLGRAHSVEAWHEGILLGGIYGVDADGAFAAESMFYLKSNASKLALLHLIDHLKHRGLDWFDIQMLTPHLQSLGAQELPRDVFLETLAATRKLGLKLF
jgi:leucyl/phenylalanyl-tRNA--protein transferase